jgi:Zn-dependent M28 family amino/carboxypeptidase
MYYSSIFFMFVLKKKEASYRSILYNDKGRRITSVTELHTLTGNMRRPVFKLL